MRVVVRDLDRLGEAGADLVRDAVDAGTVSVLGVATGSSPSPLYRELARRPPERARELTLFALDEYIGLRPGHPESYRAVVKREIADPLGIPADRVHVPDGFARDPEAAARAYEEAIVDAGGVDLQILGIGANGHVAFNEPGSAATSRTRAVELTPRTRRDNARFFAEEPVPMNALTQGIATIMRARRLLLIAHGEHKAQAIARTLEMPPHPDRPASLLREHPDLTLLLDPAAASQLGTVVR